MNTLKSTAPRMLRQTAPRVGTVTRSGARSSTARLARIAPFSSAPVGDAHDLHVIAELLALPILARRAFHVRAEILVVFLRQLSLDVFHYPVLPPPQII